MATPCPSSPEAATGRPRFEVADIFRRHGAAYRQSHALGEQQRRVMWSIEHCRTETLGGHLDTCTACGDEQPSYNSCRNRHCPKCQGLAQAAWIDKRKERVLATHYFHVVFTLPSELRPLCRRNPVAMYDLLFAAASQTLLDFGRGELGAQLGITAVLHTWTRDLKLHPHLHCVVTGGGLSGDQTKWVSASGRYLFPVRALAARFRGKVLDALRRYGNSGGLCLDGACAGWADERTFRRWLDSLYRIDWVVYAKRPFGGPRQVFEYLGRYTHRVAISNHRLLHVDDGEVRFRTRDRQQASLRPDLFIGRFLLHVLPKAFVKIRHYGLLASSNATTKLERARSLLLLTASASATLSTASRTDPPQPLDWRAQLRRLVGVDLAVCTYCGGWRRRVALGDRRPSAVGTALMAHRDTS